jgi:hypothetical protein
MPGENVQDWSTTAATNSTADSSINFAEGQAPSTVNDSARSLMAGVAKWRNLLNGSKTTGGAANVQTLTTGLSYSSLPDGLMVLVKAGFTNTASTTLNTDAIGAVTLKNQLGANLSGGEIVAGGYYWLRYTTTGPAWTLLTPVATQLAAGGYTAHTPTPLSTSGTLTSAVAAVRYQVTGKRTHLHGSVTITTNGTGATAIILDTPNTIVGDNAHGSGRIASSNVALIIQANATQGGILIWKHDGTYPGADGAVLRFSIEYESA